MKRAFAQPTGTRNFCHAPARGWPLERSDRKTTRPNHWGGTLVANGFFVKPILRANWGKIDASRKLAYYHSYLNHHISFRSASTSLTNTSLYGGAIDQKFTKDLFGGIEFFKRNLKSPFVTTDIFDNPVGRARICTNIWRVTIFFGTPNRCSALRAKYMFERLKPGIR